MGLKSQKAKQLGVRTSAELGGREVSSEQDFAEPPADADFCGQSNAREGLTGPTGCHQKKPWWCLGGVLSCRKGEWLEGTSGAQRKLAVCHPKGRESLATTIV